MPPRCRLASNKRRIMKDFDLVIRGGTFVTATDTVLADVGISGGLFAAIGTRLACGAHSTPAG
jgi:dihydropyrimidinase